MQLGRRIKELRKKRNITQQDLAEMLGVSYQAISRWENNITSPDITALPVLANIFNVTVDYLLDVNINENTQIIENIYKQSWELCVIQKHKEAQELLEEKTKLFPNNYFLKNELLNIYYVLMYDNDKEIYQDKIIDLANEIINNCLISDYKFSAIKALILIYGSKKEFTKGKELLELLPDISYSKDYLKEYVNLKDKYGYWRDNAVRIEGEAVYNTLISFAESWYISTKEILDIAKYKSKKSIKTNNIVIPFMDGPTDKYNPASDIYTSITNNAKDYLYISTPYLIIDNEFLNHLCNASNSGVDVRILVPGIPDKKLVYILTQSHFGKLLESGVKIYKYTPGFNHAKNYICDDLFGVVGSINLDYRSLYLHFENGVYIYNDEEIKKMKENFLYDLSFSEEIKLEDWKKRKWYKKIIEFILKTFSPLM